MSLSAKNFNKNRFELIYKEYHKNLCVFAQSYVSDENTASGIVQDSFIKLWEIKDSINDINKSSLKKVLLQILNLSDC